MPFPASPVAALSQVKRFALQVAVVALATFMAQPAALSAPAPAAKPPATAKPADKAPPKPTPEPVLENVVSVNAEDLVGKPQDFLGKNVKFNANFFAFSSLALDYKPAYRSSKTHLSFLVLKPNTHIPLSELKLAMMIPKEKDPESNLLATLKDGDQLELVGKVFSAALDDPWIEVFKLKKLNSASDDKKAAADADSKADKTEGKAEDKSDKEKSDKEKSDKPDKPGTAK